MPPLSVIVTCKGRLEHLSRSLPLLIENFAGAQIILVDYDCPEGAAAWTAANTSGVTVVRVEDRPIFNLAKARNLGAVAATAPWLLFTDADVLFTAPLLEILRTAMAPGRYLLPIPRPPILCGTVAASRADFDRIGGYDETFEGWAMEDHDFILRLQDIGATQHDFDGRSIACIDHSEALRTQFHDIQFRDLNWALNGAYLAAKRDLSGLNIELNPEERGTLYSGLKVAMTGGQPELRRVTHRVAFRRESLGPLDVISSLQYDIIVPRPPEPSPEPSPGLSKR